MSTVPRTVLLGLSLAFLSPALNAQETGQIINVPYAREYPLGTYDVGGQRVRTITVPLTIALQRADTNRLGISLRLAATASFHKVDIANLDFASVNIGSVVPGVQLWKMFSGRAIIGPYLDLGFASDLNSDTTAWIGTLGVQGEFIFPWHKFELGLEPRLAVTTTWTGTDALKTSFSFAQLQLNARHPLWFRIGSRQPDAGVFVIYREYFGNLELNRNTDNAIEVPREVVAGVSFGAFPAVRLWFVRLYRMSVGFRAGQNVRGFYISFGERQLTRLRPQ